jgi:hypothetical protein
LINTWAPIDPTTHVRPCTIHRLWAYTTLSHRARRRLTTTRRNLHRDLHRHSNATSLLATHRRCLLQWLLRCLKWSSTSTQAASQLDSVATFPWHRLPLTIVRLFGRMPASATAMIERQTGRDTTRTRTLAAMHLDNHPHIVVSALMTETRPRHHLVARRARQDAVPVTHTRPLHHLVVGGARQDAALTLGARPVREVGPQQHAGTTTKTSSRHHVATMATSWSVHHHMAIHLHSTPH